jgi:hypothetical protein
VTSIADTDLSGSATITPVQADDSEHSQLRGSVFAALTESDRESIDTA